MDFKKKLFLGDVVTCVEPVEAYYSGNPQCLFVPGEEGIVGSIDVPNVTGANRTFTCVDFYKDGIPWESLHSHGRHPWRCALYNDNIVVVQRAESFMHAEEIRAYAEIILASPQTPCSMGSVALYVLGLSLDRFLIQTSVLEILDKLYELRGMALCKGQVVLAIDVMTFIRTIRRQDEQQTGA